MGPSFKDFYNNGTHVYGFVCVCVGVCVGVCVCVCEKLIHLGIHPRIP